MKAATSWGQVGETTEELARYPEKSRAALTKPVLNYEDFLEKWKAG